MLYIIIVSHNHESFIDNSLEKLCESSFKDIKFRIVIKDNVNSSKLKCICEKYNVSYICSKEKMGFGANNNFAVEKIMQSYGLNKNDLLLFLNPDIIIEKNELEKLIKFLEKSEYDACTIDLFKNFSFTIRDGFIRSFPGIKDFVDSYLFGKNNTILNRKDINEATKIDWCAGSFMIIRAKAFLQVNGFDEKYFMYCEDLDISYRLSLAGYNFYYLPFFKAVHFAQHANRKILSKPFFWHLNSAMRFIIKKHLFGNNKYLCTTKSILKSVYFNHE